jgi:hypothetical protein
MGGRSGVPAVRQFAFTPFTLMLLAAGVLDRRGHYVDRQRPGDGRGR